MKYCTCHSLDGHAERQTPLTKTTHSAALHMTCGAERSAPTARRLVAAGAEGSPAAQSLLRGDGNVLRLAVVMVHMAKELTAVNCSLNG